MRPQLGAFLRTGGWHPIIILVFFLSIGLVSQLIAWHSIHLNSPFLIISVVSLIAYIILLVVAVNQFRIIRSILESPVRDGFEGALRLQNNRLVRLIRLNLERRLSRAIRITTRRRQSRQTISIVSTILIIVFAILLLLFIIFSFFQRLDSWQKTDREGVINPVKITQQKIISTYIENINSLSEDKKENRLSKARVLTLQTIKKLDEQLKNQDVSNKGKSEIVSFLYNAGLIGSLENGNTEDNGIKCQKNQDDSLYLRRVNLESIDLSHSNWQCINLKGASLQEANLKKTVLIGANLRYAILKKADLTKANLQNADLTGADLTGANLTGANLTDADLTGANLIGATTTNIKGANFKDAGAICKDITPKIDYYYPKISKQHTNSSNCPF